MHSRCGWQLLFAWIGLSLVHGLQFKEHRCIHDQIAGENPEIISLMGPGAETAKVKRHLVTGYENIRIHPVYTNIDSAVRSYVYGSNSLLSRSIEIIESILMVHPVSPDVNFRVVPNCGGYWTSGRNRGQCRYFNETPYNCGPFGVISNEYIGVRRLCPHRSRRSCYLAGPNGTGIPNTDYVLFVSASNQISQCRGSTLAFASTCYLNRNHVLRPAIGYINICPESIQGLSEDLMTGLFIHEMIHALGFDVRLFGSYVDENDNRYLPVKGIFGPYGLTFVFTGPKTVEFARKYYSCDSIEGVSLENEGRRGRLSSHWEKRVMNHEMMTAFISIDYEVFSEFTAALMEDTGWYKVNYSALSALDQPKLQWGKGLGCSFLTEQCINQSVYPYLCDVDDAGPLCTFDQLSKGVCVRPQGFDNCSIVVPVTHEGYCRNKATVVVRDDIESYTSNSICVDGLKSESRSCGNYINESLLCVSQETYKVNNITSLVLVVQGKRYSCKDDYAVMTDSNWSLLCPPTEQSVYWASYIIDSNPPVASPPVHLNMIDELKQLATITFSSAQDVVAFGRLDITDNIHGQFYINVNGDYSTTLCLLKSVSNRPDSLHAENIPGLLISITARNIYFASVGKLSVSTELTDLRSSSTDYSLVLMLDPQAINSFVYYAASIDFKGSYLKSAHSNDQSFFMVGGLASNTEVRIAPAKNITVNGKEVLYGEEYILQLDVGQSFFVSSDEDLSGSRVTSNKAVLFYSGHVCAANVSSSCSILTEQMPPYNSWGNSFFLQVKIHDLIGDSFKFIASDTGANISLNCTSDGVNYVSSNIYLGSREAAYFSTPQGCCFVSSGENIAVIQFKSSGSYNQLFDTFMTVVPALSQYKREYTFSTFGSDNYVALTVGRRKPGKLLINGVSREFRWSEVVLSGISYFFIVLRIGFARYSFRLENSLTFGAIIYGRTGLDTYALAAGMRLNIATNLPTQVPSPVQNARIAVIGGMINVTWAPPTNPNGVIYKYIIRQINSKLMSSYHDVSGNQYSILLPDTIAIRTTVVAVNLYGHSSEKVAEEDCPGKGQFLTSNCYPQNATCSNPNPAVVCDLPMCVCPRGQVLAGNTCVNGEDCPNACVVDITSGKAKYIKRRKRVRFRFTADHPSTTFECQLDNQGFSPCTSPTIWKNLNLSRGMHFVLLRANCTYNNAVKSTVLKKFKLKNTPQ